MRDGVACDLKQIGETAHLEDCRLMGLLRFIAVPLCRTFRDEKLANAILEKGNSISSLWGIFSEHAVAGSIWTIVALTGAAFAIVAMLAFLAFALVPFTMLKDWQKARIGGADQVRRFQIVWIALLGIIVLLTADAVWSNVTAFGLYEGGEQAQRMIDSVNTKISGLSAAGAETERFITGMAGNLAASLTNGKDLRPAIKIADEFATEAGSFVSFLKGNVSILSKVLTDGQFQQGQALIQALGSINDEVVLKKIGDLSMALDKIRGGAQKGLGNIASFWPSLEEARLKIVIIDQQLKSAELSRFMIVFAVLFFFVSVTAAGLQFYRMRRFRIIMLCLTFVCFLLSLMYILHAFHLVSGTLLGAFCDGIRGEGGQEPIQVATISPDVKIDLGRISRMAASCNAGNDMIKAMMDGYVEGDEAKLVQVNSNITIDPKKKEVIIKTPFSSVDFTVREKGGTDIRGALNKVIDAFIETDAVNIFRLNDTQRVAISEGAHRLGSFDFVKLEESLKMLNVLVNTLDSEPSIPAQVKPLLSTFKASALKRIDRLLKLSTQMKGQAGNLSSAADNLRDFLNNQSTRATTLRSTLQQAMKKDVAQFVAGTLEPAMECREIGKSIDSMFQTVCSAGGAMQALFLSFWLLIGAAVALGIVLLICRKYSDDQVE